MRYIYFECNNIWSQERCLPLGGHIWKVFFSLLRHPWFLLLHTIYSSAFRERSILLWPLVFHIELCSLLTASYNWSCLTYHHCAFRLLSFCIKQWRLEEELVESKSFWCWHIHVCISIVIGALLSPNRKVVSERRIVSITIGYCLSQTKSHMRTLAALLWSTKVVHILTVFTCFLGCFWPR